MNAAPSRTRWPAWLRAALCLPVALWVCFEAQRVFRADWASAAERRQVLDWVAGASAPKTEAEWEAARAAIQRSLDIVPDDPDMHERLGDVYFAAGQRDWAVPALRATDFGRAAQAYRQALTLRPGEPQTWAMLATAVQAVGQDRAQVQQAWARALALGPYEGHVQPVLMQVVLADWDGATPHMQAWARRLFDEGNEGVRRDINAMAKRYGLVFSPDQGSKP